MIEFLPEEHLYIWDGVITPSVTRVVRCALGNGDISGVPPAVLAAKAAYGNEVHEICENYLFSAAHRTIEDPNISKSVEEFAEMVGSRKIKGLASERIVGYQHRVCGKYDILADVGGKVTLLDIKTTAKFPWEYLRLQLTMYALSAEETDGIHVEELAAVWLPKGKRAKYVSIEPANLADVEKAISEYEKQNTGWEILL